MVVKMSITNNKNHENINDATMQLIAKRVAEFKRNKENSQFNDDEVDSHIGALSEVFDLDKNDVQSIANDVIDKQEQQTNLKDKIYDGLIKYGKELIIASIAVIIVSLVIFGRSSFQPQVTTPNIISLGGSSDMKLFNQKATIAKSLSRISVIRMHLNEYYLDEGKFPESLSQIGIENDFKKSKDIDQMILGDEGTILVKFKESVAKNLIVKVSPIIMNNWMEWSCETNFKGHFPGCDKASLSQDLFKNKKKLSKNSSMTQKSFAKENKLNREIVNKERLENLAKNERIKQTSKEFNARHILVKTEEEAKGIIEDIVNGADFAEMAKKKSTGPSSSKGGSLGWFKAQTMVPSFASAVEAMLKGDVSKKPVKSQFGYHVIKLEDIRG